MKTIPPIIDTLIKNRYIRAQYSLLSGGHHNINILITQRTEKIVLRSSKQDHAKAVTTLQKECMAMRSIGAPLVPQILETSFTSDSPYFTMSYVPGVHKPYDTLTVAELKTLGAQVARLHAIRKRTFATGYLALADKPGTHYDYLSHNTKNMNVMDTDYSQDLLIKTALQTLQKMMSPKYFWRKTFSMIHGDLNAHNILWRGRNISIIDWEGARYGDPADEIAYIKAINRLTDTQFENFLCGYLPLAPDPDITNRLPTYELKNRIFDVMWALGSKQHANTVKEQSYFQRAYDIRATDLRTFLKTL